jgi:hypothetical protein
MLSCRFSGPHSLHYIRRLASADRILQIVALAEEAGDDDLPPLPLVPYAISLSTTAIFRALRDGQRDLDAAYEDLSRCHRVLVALGERWTSVRGMTRLTQRLLGELAKSRALVEEQSAPSADKQRQQQQQQQHQVHRRGQGRQYFDASIGAKTASDSGKVASRPPETASSVLSFPEEHSLGSDFQGQAQLQQHIATAYSLQPDQEGLATADVSGYLQFDVAFGTLDTCEMPYYGVWDTWRYDTTSSEDNIWGSNVHSS